MTVNKILYIGLIGILTSSCHVEKKLHSESYDPEGSTETSDKTIELQTHKTWHPDKGITVSNDFPGARLNDFIHENDSLYTAVITPENLPINKSPWYAFSISSSQEKPIAIQFSYPEGYSHRYYPELSHDLMSFEVMDSSQVITDSTSGKTTILVKVGPKPLYISAQEVIPSSSVYNYSKKLSTRSFITLDTIGFSKMNKPLPLMYIGNRQSDKVIVVLGRQHPPETTGYLALQSFVNELVSDNSMAVEYRKDYLTIVIPILNPDGIDEGHWRHNAGGVDLNRDWQFFRQPETAAVRDFFQDFMKDGNRKILFEIDFHSTQEDVFYVFDKSKVTNLTGFTHAWLDKLESLYPGYKANREGTSGSSPVSTHWFNATYNAEAVTYEIGDDSPRPVIHTIGEKGADAMMSVLMSEYDN